MLNAPLDNRVNIYTVVDIVVKWLTGRPLRPSFRYLILHGPHVCPLCNSSQCACPHDETALVTTRTCRDSIRCLGVGVSVGYEFGGSRGLFTTV